jgi:hypothetical protein
MEGNGGFVGRIYECDVGCRGMGIVAGYLVLVGT